MQLRKRLGTVYTADQEKDCSLNCTDGNLYSDASLAMCVLVGVVRSTGRERFLPIYKEVEEIPPPAQA